MVHPSMVDLAAPVAAHMYSPARARRRLLRERHRRLWAFLGGLPVWSAVVFWALVAAAQRGRLPTWAMTALALWTD